MLKYSSVINNYSMPEDKGLSLAIAKILRKQKVKIVILDDDPTGIQTVHSCLLLTAVETKVLEEAFDDTIPFFYILTNSRSLNKEQARQINNDVLEKILEVNKKYNYSLIVISRSDSTLRGHFPLEPETLKNGLRHAGFLCDFPVFFIPAFLEAGRFTVGDIHYLKDGEYLIPVGESEFAQDNVFGYKSSKLQDYIIEKTGGAVKQNEIASLSIPELRTKGVEELSSFLNLLKDKKYIVVNSLEYYELQKLSLVLLNEAAIHGTNLVLRTSSSFPKAISGIEDKNLLEKKDLITKKSVGVFIVGSHVNKTSLQLNTLLEQEGVYAIEINVESVLSDSENAFREFIKQIKIALRRKLTPVVYTSRKEIRHIDKSKRLEIGREISDFIVRIVHDLPFKPAYIVAKGGITSNDILSKALEVKTARVLGQIITGVPVILTDEGAPFSKLPFIIFPGNVGDEHSLVTVYEKLR